MEKMERRYVKKTNKTSRGTEKHLMMLLILTLMISLVLYKPLLMAADNATEHKKSNAVLSEFMSKMIPLYPDTSILSAENCTPSPACVMPY